MLKEFQATQFSGSGFPLEILICVKAQLNAGIEQESTDGIVPFNAIKDADTAEFIKNVENSRLILSLLRHSENPYQTEQKPCSEKLKMRSHLTEIFEILLSVENYSQFVVENLLESVVTFFTESLKNAITWFQALEQKPSILSKTGPLSDLFCVLSIFDQFLSDLPQHESRSNLVRLVIVIF